MTEAPEPAAVTARRELLPLLAVFAVFGVQLAITWQRWADPVIDTGRELNVPARLAAGERLYDDVRYYYGPLGPYLNALLYRLFGVHTAVLVAAAVGATGVGLLALYRLARSRLEPAAAATAVSATIVLAMFLPNGGCLALPYSWDTLYASVCGWWALSLAVAANDRRRDTAIGLLLALAALAKVDVAVQLGVPIVALMLTGAAADRRRLSHVLPAAVLPTVIGYAVCARGIALETLIGEGFLAVVAVPDEWRRLYALMSGFDRPGTRLVEWLVVAVVAAAIVGGASFGQRLLDRRGGLVAASWPPIVALLLILTFSAGLGDGGAIGATVRRLPPMVRLLPPLALAVAAWLGIARLRGRRENGALFLLASAATLAAGRVFLNARHSTPYSAFGLILAVLLAAMLLFAPPLRSRRRGWTQLAAAMMVAWILCRGVAGWLAFRAVDEWGPLETGRGRFMVTSPARAAAIDETVRYLIANTAPVDRVATFPEGSIFNFLAERQSPLRQEQLLPGMLDAEAEQRVIQELSAAPPEWVVLGDVDYRLWGRGHFGDDWAQGLGQFLHQNYRLDATLGDPNDPMAIAWANKSVFHVLRRR